MSKHERDRIIPREQALAAAAEIYLDAKIQMEIKKAIAALENEETSAPRSPHVEL